MNSSLNPTAPEFINNLPFLTQDGYTRVSKVVQSSQQFPSGSSYDIFKIFTDFNIVSYNINENVIKQSNHILYTELSGSKLKCNDNEYNIEKITDANDNMLDRVNVHMDTINGVNVPSQQFMQGVLTPIISQIKVGTTTFIGAKNIPRPQLWFKDTIDNSASMWVPKISDKPNSIEPLTLKLHYDIKGKSIGYEHPYKHELSLYEPIEKFVMPDPHMPIFPIPLSQTNLTFVKSEDKLDDLIEHLKTVDEVAVDLEHHSYRSYQGITCLMQLSTDTGGDFIIDTLVVRECMKKLNIIFTDPKILKVFHGADNDMLWLQRDFGVYTVGLFDTHQAAIALNLPGKALKHLLLQYCNIDIDKSHQMADWRIRPLPKQMISYAQTDTHYLLYVWRMMKLQLLQTAGGDPHLLQEVFKKSHKLCKQRYNKQIIDDASHLPMYFSSNKQFDNRQKAALKMLFQWRDACAREADESCQYIMPNSVLLNLSEQLPQDEHGVIACCDFVPQYVSQNISAIHKMILKCRDMPSESLQCVTHENNAVQLYPENQQAAANEFHDISNSSDNGEHHVSVDYITNDVFVDWYNFYPDIQMFKPATNPESYQKTFPTFVSELNAEAEVFIPPYDRYRGYLSISKNQEIKVHNQSESKLSALDKVDKFIHKQIVPNLQQSKTQVAQEVNDTSNIANCVDSRDHNDSEVNKAQRKRKISNEHSEERQAKDVTEKKIDSLHRKR